MRTYGVDEAGRGPILGPMVLAAVGVTPESAKALSQAGVVDSKSFGSGQKAKDLRAELSDAIRQIADVYAVEEVAVDTIDEHVFRGGLNVLEREVAHRLLTTVKAPRNANIICDGARLFAPMRRDWPELVAVDKGESAHVSVAAASILAKHARDQAFAAIAARYEAQFGEIRGGGYVNAATRRFLAAYEDVHGTLPPEARKSWGARKQAGV